MILIAAVLAILCSLAVAHDLYRRRSKLGDVLLSRDLAPRAYWLAIGVWGLCIAGSVGVIAEEAEDSPDRPSPVTVVMLAPEQP